jgi:pimeloyl-ACP methyl ester carboxylesterase
VFLHGFKGYMDWGCWHGVGNEFAAVGLRFLRFNFTHNGTSAEQPREFVDLEGFAQNNYLIELNEARAVLDWAKEEFWIPNAPGEPEASPAPIHLIGHSRGGGIAVLAAAATPAVQSLACWAGVDDFATRFPTGKALAQWKRTGRLDMLNGRTGQIMHINYQHFSTFQTHKAALDIPAAARRFKKPALILHGTSDGAVAESCAHNLHAALPQSELHFIQRAGHTFGAHEPWEHDNLPTHLAEVTGRTIDFFRR